MGRRAGRMTAGRSRHRPGTYMRQAVQRDCRFVVREPFRIAPRESRKRKKTRRGHPLKRTSSFGSRAFPVHARIGYLVCRLSGGRP